MLTYNKDLIKYAKQLRKTMTPWEIKLWTQFLRDYPIRFQRQKVIDNYIVDFYCAKARIVIELDGGGHYTEEQQKYDEKRTENLNKYKLKVIRICNIDIDNNFYNVCEHIDREVKKSLPQSASQTAKSRLPARSVLLLRRGLHWRPAPRQREHDNCLITVDETARVLPSLFVYKIIQSNPLQPSLMTLSKVS